MNRSSPTTLEYRQGRLDTQEFPPGDSWATRIQWIVDTYETGDTVSARLGEAGKKLGLSSEAVRLLYRGKSVPSGDTLAAIVRAYPRVNPMYLLLGTGPRERTTQDGADPFVAGAAHAVEKMMGAIREILETTGSSADGAARERTERERRELENMERVTRDLQQPQHVRRPKRRDAGG